MFVRVSPVAILSGVYYCPVANADRDSTPPPVIAKVAVSFTGNDCSGSSCMQLACMRACEAFVVVLP